MSKAFVPLTLPARVQAAAAGFQPLSSMPHAMASAGQRAAHSPAPPRVTLQRDGDRVTHIRVECGCGEVFELACVYQT